MIDRRQLDSAGGYSMAIMRKLSAAGTGVARGSAPPAPAAAADQDSTPRPGFAVLGILLAVAAALAGWVVFKKVAPEPFRPSSDYSVFAGLFIISAAVERFLEPFTVYAKPDTEEAKKQLDHA